MKSQPISKTPQSYFIFLSFPSNSCKSNAPPGGLEPPTFRLTAERARQLRHGGNVMTVVKIGLIPKICVLINLSKNESSCVIFLQLIH